ncbi:transglycosylase domain-containing protein [Marmoricola sp. URHB0036]|uniref:transglycosylase domain-containing protein n=1 Tax=Marmoricola sp. URHB0036 TaxID=1298863 RepID=UPI000416F988|nr:transglycosylase domain-containing protein [Marmoricola sp. URHB0036]
MSRRRTHLTFGTVISHLGVIVAVSAVLGVLAAGLVIPLVGAVGYGASATARSMQNLPEELKAAPLAERSRVLDRNGNTIATFYDENRVNVSLSKVAPIMRRAIIAIEDYRFYQHGALDVKGTLRAFVNNQTSGGGTQGGSSITQQMAKMTLLAQARTEAERKAATENTYQRKIQELRHAIAFEQNYSKDWILERYLNLAYFGDGAYGIQAAARHFFSVNASQLNTVQAATLAGLVKNPVGFDPTRFKDRAITRRNVVLNRMAQLNVIAPETAVRLGKTPLGLKVSKRRNGCVGTDAAFFCDYVRRYLLADPALGRTVADRVQLINSGGLTIKTTVDLRFQRAADAAAKESVKPQDQAIGALAMVKPGTGAVLAIAQSRPMGRDRKKGQTFLNYIVNNKYGDSNGFQAGSTFKLFVMAAALEQGLPASTSFNSPAQVHIPQNEFPDCDGNYPSTALWEPHNSTDDGYFNMYQGAQLSVNTYFAQLEKKTGLCKPFALARSMGVELDHPHSERVPSFTLGVADVSPLEMAGAYATVAARGRYCETQPVTKILNSSGKVFKDYRPQCRQVMKQDTADTINDILHGVMEPGGFGQALNIDKESAGKTGTIQNNKAVWFDGYTPELATAAMIAGANSKGTPITLNGQSVGGRYIDVAHGSTVAGPMWALAMRRVQDLIPATAFTPPIAPEPRPYVPKAPSPPKQHGHRNHGGGNGGGGHGH